MRKRVVTVAAVQPSMLNREHKKGWFVVDNVSHVNGSLASIDLRFEQHCEGSAPALRGQNRWVK